MPRDDWARDKARQVGRDAIQARFAGAAAARSPKKVKQFTPQEGKRPKGYLYCKVCLYKCKGKAGAKCPCGNDWSSCKTRKSRNGMVTRLHNQRHGKGTKKPSTKSKYQEYLASPLWESIRLRVLDRDSGTCQVCLKKASVVHHRDYSSQTMSGDSIDALIALCRKCHKKVHRNESGKRHGIRATEQKLVIMMPKRPEIAADPARG